MLDARYGAHLTTQTHFTGHTPAAVDGCVDIRREYGGNDTQVHRHIGDAQSAGDVEENVFLHEFEAYALFEYGQQHVQTALVETGSCALGGTIGG